MVAFLIDIEDTDLDALGVDGVSPLCAATIWGYESIVRMLVDAACDPNMRNGDRSTALHAAACQENGKLIHLLLQAGADATLQDAEGRTASDFASVSDGLWPLFGARGLTRTPKGELVAKRVIRKVYEEDEGSGGIDDDGNSSAGGSGGTSDGGGSSGTLPFYSRPGSAYTRSESLASYRPARAAEGGMAAASQLPGVPEHGDMGGVDPLEHADDEPTSPGAGGGAGSTEPTFRFWRDD